ncbi:hypothetical protein BYT27DRAFT_7221976 [Phlegmacium glaucopus]|nr:hypothetical protein BYT27DRAFT_7221976 [Phlegmacium glaucopus]
MHSTDKKSKNSSSAVKPVESDEEEAIPEDTWPKALHLRPGALTQQMDLIHATCCDAIWIVKNMLVTQHAWPELYQGALYKCQVLTDADTRDNEGRQKELYSALLTQISRDENFVRSIGKWVVDHLSHHRGQMQSAASNHITIFQLGVGDVCAQHVQALIENNMYIYPGQWATDKDRKIYLNPDHFFNGPTAFGYKFKKHYVTLHPDHKEPKLTIPVVALGVTAFFAALYEWHEGKKVKMSADSSKVARAEKFEGNNFKNVYDRHVKTLSKLKMKVNAYHHVMSSLYSKVVNGDNAVNTGALAKGSVLAVLDLDRLV